jgi:hypothetical protein
MREVRVKETSRLVLAVMILTSAVVAAQVGGQGRIAGLVTDAVGGPVPGAQVTLSAGDQQKETWTDREGRFAFDSLPLTPHHVDVRLPGFMPVSGTLTLSPEIRRADIRWALTIGCLHDPPLTVLPPLHQHAGIAASIVHVRVEADNGLVLVSHRPECTGEVVREYSLQVLRGVPDRTPAETMLQVRVRPPTMLDTGAEYVALLGGANRLLPVVSGRIASPAEEALNGMRVEDAVEQLRKWSQEGSQRE